jgi:hypothetical protein
MVRVNADLVPLQVVRKFTGVNSPKFVMRLKFWPAPKTTVYDVRKAFTM